MVAVVKMCEQVTGEGVPPVIVVTQNGLFVGSCASLKDTVPVCGVTVPVKPEPLVAANVAVKVTDWFTVEGLSPEETVVVVGAAPTVWATVGALPAVKFESPL